MRDLVQVTDHLHGKTYRAEHPSTKPAKLKSLVKKRAIIVAGHKTSVTLEEQFWISLKDIAGIGGLALNDLITKIDDGRHQGCCLSSSLRLFVLDYYRSIAAERAAG